MSVSQIPHSNQYLKTARFTRQTTRALASVLDSPALIIFLVFAFSMVVALKKTLSNYDEYLGLAQYFVMVNLEVGRKGPMD